MDSYKNVIFKTMEDRKLDEKCRQNVLEIFKESTDLIMNRVGRPTERVEFQKVYRKAMIFAIPLISAYIESLIAIADGNFEEHVKKVRQHFVEKVKRNENSGPR